MADTFLSEEMAASLRSGEEIMVALADKFLDAEGEIEPPYQQLLQAQYVRDRTELQTLKPIMDRAPDLDDMTAHEAAELESLLKKAGYGKADDASRDSLAYNSMEQAAEATERSPLTSG